MKSLTSLSVLSISLAGVFLNACGTESNSQLSEDPAKAFIRTVEIPDSGEKNQGIDILQVKEDGSFTFEAKIPGPKDKVCVIDSAAQTHKALDCSNLVQISLELTTPDNAIDIDHAFLVVSVKDTAQVGEDTIPVETITEVRLEKMLGRMNSSNPIKNHYLDQKILESFGSDYEARLVITAHQAPEASKGGGFFGEMRALSDAGIRLKIFRGE